MKHTYAGRATVINILGKWKFLELFCSLQNAGINFRWKAGRRNIYHATEPMDRGIELTSLVVVISRFCPVFDLPLKLDL